MKKFSNFEQNKNENDTNTNINNDLTKILNKMLKESVFIEVSGDEKPWDRDIEIKTNVDTDLLSKLTHYVNEEIQKSNLILLEKMRISYYNNNILDTIENEINILRKK